MVISEAFDRYCLEEIQLKGGAPKTIRNYQSVKSSFIRICGDMPVTLITRDHGIRWQLCLEAEGKPSSTRSGYSSGLRMVLKYLKKRDHNVLDHYQVELPRVIIERKDHVTPIEARQMIDYATRSRDKALMAVLWSSGSRISEILNLNRDALTATKQHVVGKNSKDVVVRLDDTARELIGKYLEERHDRLPALFISSQMRRMTVQRAEQIVNQICGELGLQRPDGMEKNITPHSFRRGLATDMDLNGAGIVDIQVALQHTNISTTRGYINVSERRGDEVHARFHTKV